MKPERRDDDGRLAKNRQVTDHQRMILRYIKEFTHKNGYPPSLSDISEELGNSLTAARQSITSLVAKGVLSRVPRQGRTLRIPEKGLRILYPRVPR